MVEVRPYCSFFGCIGNYTYYDVTVKTASTTPVTWQVTMHLDHEIFEGVTDLGNSVGNQNEAGLFSCSASPSRVLVLTGQALGNDASFRTVSVATPRTFSLVVGSPASDDLVTCL